MPNRRVMRPAIETGLRLLALTAWCAQAIALPPEDKSAQLPSAKEIIERALERADWLKGQKVEEKYTFSEAVLAEKLHADKSIRQREHSRYEVYPVEGVLFRRLVEKNGRPPSAEEVAWENQKERDLREQLKRGEKPKEDENRIEFNRDLTSRFRADVVSRELLQGRPTYVLRFEPKSGRLPIRRRIDYALNESAGRMMIDEETYEVARVEFHLINPVRLWWGLLGKLREAEGSLERRPLTDGYWAPTELKTYVYGRVLFSFFHRRRQTAWGGYRRWAESPAEAAPVDSSQQVSPLPR